MCGCIDTLEWFREKKICLGLCSSNSQKVAESVLVSQGIRTYFASVVGRTIDLPLKPDPAQILECSKQLKANPKNSIVIGDSHNDVIAGKKVGVYTIGIPMYFT